jgi:hypothetical protein
MAGAVAGAQVPMQTTLHNPTGQTCIIRLMAPLKGDSSMKVAVMPSEAVKDAPEPPEALATGDPHYDYLAFKAVLPPRHRAVFTGDRGTQNLPVLSVDFTLERDERLDKDIPNPVAGWFVYVSEASWGPEIPASVALLEVRFGPKVPFTFESVPSLLAGKNTTEGMLRVRASVPLDREESKNMGSEPAVTGAAAAAPASVTGAAAAAAASSVTDAAAAAAAPLPGPPAASAGGSGRSQGAPMKGSGRTRRGARRVVPG